MRPELRAVAPRHGGVFRRSEAVACGCTEREMKTATGPGGAWVVVRRGCYAERSRWERLDDEGRYALRVRAALLAQVRDGVPSHGSAAVLLGMPTRPAVARAGARHPARRHRAPGPRTASSTTSRRTARTT